MDDMASLMDDVTLAAYRSAAQCLWQRPQPRSGSTIAAVAAATGKIG
jgi:hypothetical protein